MTEPLPHLPSAPTAPVAELEFFAAAHRAQALPNSILQEEIRVLRERGFSDECIHGLLRGFNIDVRPEPAGDHWKLALNDQLVRLIWGKSAPLTTQAD